MKNVMSCTGKVTLVTMFSAMFVLAFSFSTQMAADAACYEKISCSDTCDPISVGGSSYEQCKEVKKKANECTTGVGTTDTGNCGKKYTNPNGSTECTNQTQSVCGSAPYKVGTC